MSSTIYQLHHPLIRTLPIRIKVHLKVTQLKQFPQRYHQKKTFQSGTKRNKTLGETRITIAQLKLRRIWEIVKRTIVKIMSASFPIIIIILIIKVTTIILKVTIIIRILIIKVTIII